MRAVPSTHRRSVLGGVAMGLLLGSALWVACQAAPKEALMTETLQVTSPAFIQGSEIPTVFTCDGDDISPPLQIHGVSNQSKSLALIVEDPDAPIGTYYHWLLWNIPPSTRIIPQGQVPAGAVLGTNSFKRTSYGGPCPPFGAHRYFFRLYGLDTMLDLPAGASERQLKKAMEAHMIEQGHLMGTYTRHRS